jgi:hypothetical protein
MGTSYDQLSADERVIIAGLQAQGRSLNQIAAALDRSPSTISRELNRNAGRQVGYRAIYAQQQARARRWKGSRLERDPDLRQQVLDGLKKGWSPEQVCGWLQRQQGRRAMPRCRPATWCSGKCPTRSIASCASSWRADRAAPEFPSPSPCGTGWGRGATHSLSALFLRYAGGGRHP